MPVDGQKLSLPRSLSHLAFGWELTSRLPAYLKNGCDERESGSEPFGLDDNESRAGEWISGSIRKTPRDGNSRSHNLRISARGVVPMCCFCGIRSLKPLCNDCKKSCANHPPVTCIFRDTPLIIFTCPPAQGVRAHDNNQTTAGTDSVLTWILAICVDITMLSW